MQENIKSIFDDECSKLEIGPKLVKRLQHYWLSFINKNEDHIKFFGGHLTGVDIVRFTDQDRNVWFDEIMEIVDGPVEERLIALPTVNAEWHVSSDTMNLSCIWLCNAIFINKHLNDTQKHDAMINVMLVLQVKFLTSRLFRHFRYPADRAVAEATYAQLSYKYAIKTYGSWNAVLVARAEDIIAKDGIHHDVFSKMDKDARVVNALNDIQGRIRDMLKNIMDVHLNASRQGDRISSTSSVVEHDGVSILKDKSKNLLSYTRYINSVVSDKNSFIREELVSIIEKLIHTMPPKLFKESLEWMSNNYRQTGATQVEETINEMMLFCFEYLDNNRALIKNANDLPGLLSKLKGVLMSARSTETSLFSLREKAESIVKNATGNKNDSIIASTRTGILLYICLRAFTMRHYNQS